MVVSTDRSGRARCSTTYALGVSELPTLAVTGSTGGLGGRVARRLAASDVAQRLLVRDASRAPALDGAVPVTFTDYADHDSSVAALQGVTTLFMVSAAENADRLAQHHAFVDAAAEAGVRHVVYTSFAGAAADSIFTLGRDHHFTEAHIRASGMDWTFLRDNLYLDFFPQIVGEDGVIRGPAGDGVVAAVTRDDVAASAAAVLADPGAHVGSTYVLTGPEAITMTQVAETISRAQGREVRFHDETLAEAYESRRKWGAPDWQNDAWVSTYTAIAGGEMAAVSDDVLRLTGRRPTSLAEWLEQE
jgi:NAD(P)H dehydrogenase (quinone)